MHPILEESAGATAQSVGTAYFAKVIGTTLNLIGDEIGSHITNDDEPGLFIPVDVVVQNKERTGGVLALEDRLIVAWSVGLFRPKPHSVVLERTAITGVETSSDGGGAVTKPRRIVRIDAGSSHWLKLPWFDHDGGNDISTLAIGVLDGSIKPVFDAEGEVA